LKNMREIWKAKSQLRRHRRQAMRLIGMVDTTEPHGKREMEDMLRSLHNKGLISSEATLDDILLLGTEDILNRRLQAQVYYKGLAISMKQARQFVTHGKIVIGNQKVTIPSYPLSRDEEENLTWHPSCPWVENSEHPIRKAIDGRASSAEYGVEQEEVDPEATQEFAKEVVVAAEEAPSAPKEGGDE
jgi:small subunit ribosomal protein S4